MTTSFLVERFNEKVAFLMDIKDEIIKRMKKLQLHQNVINELMNNNQLNRSEAPLGSLYWLTDEEKGMVNTFEKENKNVKVFHVLKTYSKYLGTVYDLLFISKDEENWNIEEENLEDNLVLSHTITNFPEDGFIKIKSVNGGLVRLY